MESDSFFEARTCYEDGMHLCSEKDVDEDMKSVFSERIDTANLKLAERNIHEAEFSYSRGDVTKALEHLELVKTLSHDPDVREKADRLLSVYSVPDDDHDEPVAVSSCASCAGSSGDGCGDSAPSDDSLPLLEYYELLIQQLPVDQYQRYAELGEDFATAYLAASRDHHLEALSGYEKCSALLPGDIFWYETGKVLHRLGRDSESEQHLRRAVQLNGTNSLAWFNLALVLRENNQFHDAMSTIESMISMQILPEQALMLRADIFEVTGNHEAAINQYVDLLQTPYAHAAAEKLVVILAENGRHSDAAVIYTKYLKKSCH